MLLDQTLWDICCDAGGNWAVASAPYQLAQDAASAIKTFLGECYYDATYGVPYFTDILATGQMPPLSLIKADLVNAALSVPGVASAEVFITSLGGRQLSGQVQVTSSDGTLTAASF